MIKQASQISLFKPWLITIGIFLVIIVLCLFFTNSIITLSPGAPKFIGSETTGAEGIIPSIFILFLFSLIYYISYKGWMQEYVLFALGAVVVIIFGRYLNFYDLSQAWKSLTDKISVLHFLIGLNILTIILDESGLFNYIAKRIIASSKNRNEWKIMFFACLITYFVSLFVNNLTTIMAFIPVIFSLSKYLKFDPKLYLIGMIVASNLGGASTMIGDFPNIIIGTEAKVKFFQFILHMMPICLLELFILFLYLRITQNKYFADFVSKKQNPEYNKGQSKKEVYEFMEDLNQSVTPNQISMFLKGNKSNGIKNQLRNSSLAKRGFIILAGLIIAFFISDFIDISPAIIALAAGLIALFFSGIKKGMILERLNYKDIVFFSGLFILVGAAEASGLITWVEEIIVHLSFGKPLIQCLLLMWFAALVTAFFNAGPTTALFLPIAMYLQIGQPNNICWWSLSLGVLAGSSATITGATAGPVTSSMLYEFSGKPLTLKEYVRIGLPISIIFLIVSTIYIIWLY